MAQNLYQDLYTLARDAARKLGWSELVRIPLRMAVSPLLIPVLPRRTFQFQGRRFDQFYHCYNITWASERRVEIPIARGLLADAAPEDVLEIGNVLGHYQTVQHRVIDKLERVPGVLNEDVMDLQPPSPLDLIIFISTFQHIGFDDEPGQESRPKIAAAAQRRPSWPVPGGGWFSRRPPATARSVTACSASVCSSPPG